MDTFSNALLSSKTDRIPEEYDWFAPLIGDWDFDFTYRLDSPNPTHAQGEWLFRRILEGAGIEDLFICPSREARKTPRPDGEYGVTVRLFNAKKKCYDASYSTFGSSVTRLTFVKENGMLVGSIHGSKKWKWVFTEISQDAFHWQNITVQDDGTWHVNADVQARRWKQRGGARK